MSTLKKYNSVAGKSLILTDLPLEEDLEKKLEDLYEAYVIEVLEAEVTKTDFKNHVKNLNYLMSRIEKQMIQSYENNEEIYSNLFKLFVKTYAYLDYFSCKENYYASFPNISSISDSERLRKGLFKKLFKFPIFPPDEKELRDYAKRIKDLH
jgi:hypothetical protein